MIKVLWICNIMPPAIAKARKLPYSNREGWLSGIFDRIKTSKESTAIELGICFPVEAEQMVERFEVEHTICYGFYENLNRPEIYEKSLEQRFTEIYQDFKPDVVHIFGTEFPHALAAAISFNNPLRTLVGMQGLCSEITKVYEAGLPQKIFNKVSFRDWIKKDSLIQQKVKFEKRSIQEQTLIKAVGHITGRTQFDREAVIKMNPQVTYHFMNETMREEFYSEEWRMENCEKHSIFLGQGDYPLKGFHLMIQAMPMILQKYPDTKLYVGGNSIISKQNLMDNIKRSAYGNYLLSLIEKNHLQEQVLMTGKLTAREMKERFLKSHIFVCPSILENSPNMVAEAMLLGVPTVAAYVGGIPDFITDGKEGILFPAANIEKLAEAVLQLFDEKNEKQGQALAQYFSKNARMRANQTYDGEKNYHKLLEIYQEIAETS